ncbi:Retrovirus-related Pol polyprotein, partial [Aphis craccivora]
FHRKNHWTPGISVEMNSPLIFKNITINTIFPDLNIIKGNIGKYLNEYPNTLQLSNQNFVENKNKNNDDTITNMECRQRVLSIKVEYEGNEKYAILDTGSNLSCIDYSLTKNKQLMEPKENIIITGADNTELKQLGRIEITIQIKNYHYLINAYVIEGLHCKLLLGNDFNIKNNVIIDFKNRKIQITNNTIPMNEIWYDYNKNNITKIHTKINYITSIIYNEKGQNNIENKNITIPHEQKFNYKNTYTNTNKNEKEKKAIQTNDLKLETQILNKNEKKQS